MAKPEEQKAKGTWKQFKGRLREGWGSLSGDELEKFKGRREQLEGYLEKETGESREEIRKKLEKYEKDTGYKI